MICILCIYMSLLGLNSCSIVLCCVVMFPPILHRVHKVSWVRQVSLASRMRNVTKPVLQIRGTNFNLSSLKLSNESPNITEML